jgi:hypothetical protein
MSMHPFVTGATAMACLAITVFFLRFYRDTRDRLFLLFAVAFALLCAGRVMLAFVHPTEEREPWFFVPRLVAFVLIAAAIVDKNRRR